MYIACIFLRPHIVYSVYMLCMFHICCVLGQRGRDSGRGVHCLVQNNLQLKVAATAVILVLGLGWRRSGRTWGKGKLAQHWYQGSAVPRGEQDTQGSCFLLICISVPLPAQAHT